MAFSCKGRGVCPSCNGRHMAQTAAHLVDHVIPPVTVRQWVISVPKRLRGFLANRPEAVKILTKVFLDEIERLLCVAADAKPAAKTAAAARLRLGAVSFLHRFGSALSHHVHLHACVTDGVFMPPATGTASDAPPAFLPARPISQTDLAAVTEKVRRRLIGSPTSCRRRASTGTGITASLRRITRSGPPSRRMTKGNVGKRQEPEANGHASGGHGTGGCCDSSHEHQKPRSHDTSRIAWAKLMARVGEEFPFACPNCWGDIRLIAFKLFYQCETIPGLRTVGNLRLLRTSCPRSEADPEDPHAFR